MINAFLRVEKLKTLKCFKYYEKKIKYKLPGMRIMSVVSINFSF